MAAIELRVHSRISDDLGTAWGELARRRDAPPWLHPSWFAAWSWAFSTGETVIVSAERDGCLVGVLPLHRRGAALHGMSNYHTPSFEILAEDAQARRAVADEACRLAPGRLELRFLPEDGESVAAGVEAARRAGRRTLVRVVERSPVVDTRGGWNAYEASLRSGLRHELRRRRRRLEEQGSLRLDVHDGRELLEGLLTQGFEVERSGWKGDRGTAIATSERTRGFYERVAAAAARDSTLRLAFLRLDDRPIAFDFGIEHGGAHFLLKTGYLDSMRPYGPGMLLRYEMLRRAFETGLRRYCFLGQDDAWKRAWTSKTEAQVLLQVMSEGPVGVLEACAFGHARPMLLRALRRARCSRS